MNKITKKIAYAAILIIAIVYNFLFGGNSNDADYSFRTDELLTEHFEKHGQETNCENEIEYLNKANAVIDNPEALHKTEKEDGDDVYYLEASNELVIVSTDGYIRTYFLPDQGKDFYDKQ